MRTSCYDALARAVCQPESSYLQVLGDSIAELRGPYPEAAKALSRLRDALPAEGISELYTRTFDVQPITSLDIGYTLFGEDYKRGALLAGLSREHTQAGVDCGHELADHLANVLRLLPRMADEDTRQELVHIMLGPAVAEMIREFEPDRIEKKEALYKKHHKTIIETASAELRTVFLSALEAVFEVLRADFGLKRGLPVVQESKFVGAIDAEMGIEDGGAGCSPQ